METWAPKLSKTLQRLPRRELPASLKRSAIRLQKEARRRAPKGKGNLTAAIVAKADGADGVTLSMPLKYAPHEFGGVIRPKNAKALKVPLGGGAPSTADLFLLVAKDGRRYLATGRGAGLKLRYILLKSVTITGKGFMAGALEAEARVFPDKILTTLERAVLDG